jgi:large conductance mechanosensitive channel
MGIIKEFKEFAMRGSAVDMAVGIVIGVAFGNVVTSLVEDIVKPIIGFFTGGAYVDRYRTLLQGDGESAVYMSWGRFLDNVFQLTIIAFAILLVVKAFNTAKKRFEAEKASEPPAAPSTEVQLLTEIRDLLNG